MLKILLESFLLDCAELNKDANKEINYLYETLGSNFLSDLQKEIKATAIGIQELKLLAHEIINSEEFKEELSELHIEVNQDPAVEVYNEVVNVLMGNDKNATYNEILQDNNNDYKAAINELINCLENLISESEEKEFYNKLYNKLINL